ncbi:peptidoglycan-binding domain-containing protein [Amycolatopsis sp. lyj-346]|uniref:peptidoglycan-binding domain-containing protein n=1 Tax=Amycolatopsis sp. lyj-346 TaxID=2789289 RepID=UPI00397C3F0B
MVQVGRFFVAALDARFRWRVARSTRLLTADSRALRRGSRGDDVARVQDRLNAHGAAPPLAADRLFGPLTDAAARHYQRGHPLTADGVVGRARWRRSGAEATRVGPYGVSRRCRPTLGARRSAQELFLWNIMFRLGQRSRWATSSQPSTSPQAG